MNSGGGAGRKASAHIEDELGKSACKLLLEGFIQFHFPILYSLIGWFHGDFWEFEASSEYRKPFLVL